MSHVRVYMTQKKGWVYYGCSKDDAAVLEEHEVSPHPPELQVEG
jgi:hypothetical protein